MTTRTSRASKRWMMVAAAAVACGSTLALSGAASAGPGTTAPTASRADGANRFDTAAKVAALIGGRDVVIANGRNFPDGLAASIYSKPILLTESNTLPAETAAYLATIAPASITVVGGPNVVSGEVFEALGAFGVTTRVSGADRYATAIKIAAAGDPAPGGTVILTTGLNFPDALAAGPLTAMASAPIILNDGASLRPDVVAYLNAKAPTKVYILGGTNAVPASVQTQLSSSLGITVERLQGAERDGTAVAIANELADFDADYLFGVTAVNGQAFADALSAAPLAIAVQAPILLVNADSIPAATAAYHVRNCNTIANIRAIGGTSVISAGVVAGAVGAATCTAPKVTAATIGVSDVKQRTIALTGTGISLAFSATGPAAGIKANAYTITFVNSGINPGVTVLGNAVTFTAPFPNTSKAIVDLWNNDPDGAALATATTLTPDVVVVAPPTQVNTPATNDVTVVITFSGPVVNAANMALPPRSALHDTSVFGSAITLTAAAATVTPAAVVPATGVTSVTQVWSDVTVGPTPGDSVQFGPGSFRTAPAGAVNAVSVTPVTPA